ncbi:MAG: hypothetical protein LBI73_00350 [Myroides sp.]|jgi:hypothetical protein|nr:hypothetical protein [Myroides sp.]
MKHYINHIAWLLILIFAVFGVEKTNFSAKSICSKDLRFCPTANMYVYNIFEIANDHSSKEKKENNSTKVITISCETFFLNQIEIAISTKQNSVYDYSVFYYKPVIHSTPYIPLTDPPPIV